MAGLIRVETVPAKTVSVDISLTDQEARVLERILANVGGNPDAGMPRAAVDSIMRVLRQAGYSVLRGREDTSIRLTGEIVVN